MEIKRIVPEDTYGLRHAILRPSQPVEECRYEQDGEADSFHLGACLDGRLISIASFYREKHPGIHLQVQYRLRGMASLPEFRGLGAGSALIREAESILRERLAGAWWCNARLSASGYYEKLGLVQKGPIFDLPPLGDHKVMVKFLNGGIEET